MGNNYRSDGINIIKCLACFFVPALHYYVNWGYMDRIVHLSNNMILEMSFRWLFFSCIGLYIMCTGYLSINKEFNKKYYLKLIRTVIVFLLICILTVIIKEQSTGIDFVRKLCGFFFQYTGYFWYMGFYIGFYIIIPFINIMINSMGRRMHMYFIIALLLITAIPPFVNWMPPVFTWKYFYLPSYWEQFFPLTYYVIGAYLKRYNPHIFKPLVIGGIIVVPIAISAFECWVNNGKQVVFIGGGYGSIITVTISVALFLLLYNINISNKKISGIVAYLASLTLYSYLFLLVSDKYTRIIMGKICLQDILPFKYMLVEVCLNYILSLVLAIMMDRFIFVLMKIFIKTKYYFDRKKNTLVDVEKKM